MDLKKFANLERKSGKPDLVEHADLRACWEFVCRRHRDDRRSFNASQRGKREGYEVPRHFLRLELDRIERVREYCAWIMAGEGEAVDQERLRRTGMSTKEIMERYSMRAQCEAILHEVAFFYCAPPYDFPCGMNPFYHPKQSREDAYYFLTQILHKSDKLAHIVANAVARQNFLPYVRRKICEPVEMPKEPEDWILRDAILLDDGDIFGMHRGLLLRQVPGSLFWHEDDDGDFFAAWRAVITIHGEAFAQNGEMGEIKTSTARAIRDGLRARTRRLILAVEEIPIKSMESFREFFPAFVRGELSSRVKLQWNTP